MNRLSFGFVAVTVFFLSVKAAGQTMVYRNDTSWKTFAYNVERPFGFSGGFNNPQLGMGDLNNDGRKDLIVFEKGSVQIKTFLSYGVPGNPDYRYRPLYEKNFPVNNGTRAIKSYLKIEDLNCDNIPDLITRGGNGFSVYYGYYNNSQLCFKYYKDLFYSPLTAMSEGFESVSFPSSAGWKIKNSGNAGWNRVTSGSNPPVSPQQASGMIMFNSNALPAGNTGLLISRKFRISPNLKSEAKISFWMYRDNAGAGDSVSVYINNDTSLINATYLDRVARCRSINQPDTKASDGWYQYTFNVPFSLVGNSLYLIFKGISQAGNNIFLDNVYWITSPANGDVNAYVDPGGDIPGVGDPDNDGDLDFFAFNISGGFINFYKNYQKEENLPCDSIHINLKDGCWGKVYQGSRMEQTLGMDCPSWQPVIPPAKVTHTGNTLCMLDYDGDGDLDYLNGGVSYNNIQYLKNGKADFSYFRDTIIAQDTTWQSTGTIYQSPQFPAAFYIDFDQDGKKDILVSPSAEAASENYHSVAFYRNTGTVSAPSFTYLYDTLLASQTIDLGTGSYPTSYDYNRDGKPDLLIGGDGYFQSNGTLRARLALYLNTSSGSSKSFTLLDNNFLDVDAQNLKGAYPATGDLDNDGRDDLVVGHANGTISFYKNVAASAAAQPQWQLTIPSLKDNLNVTIDSAQMAFPLIYDMDKDGKKDLIIGGISGYLYYYKNLGLVNTVSLQYNTNALGGIRPDAWNVFSYAAPFIGKIDNSNTEYLVVGSNSGRLWVYTGFQNGNVTMPYQLIDSAHSSLNIVLGKYSGFRSVPTFADYDGDGQQELVMGNVLGGVTIYNQVLASSVDDSLQAGNVSVFPNPAKDKIRIRWDSSFIRSQDVSVTILNISGQTLVRTTLPSGNMAGEVNIGALATGLYFCRVGSGNQQAVFKLAVLK